MTRVRTNLLAAGVVAALAFSPIALAGPEGAPGPAAGAPPGGGSPQQAAAMLQQRHAERMKSLEEQLQPKPEQQAAWTAFRTAQDTYQNDMIKSRQEVSTKEATAMAQLERQVRVAEKDLANLKAVSKATGELYSGLDPTQKKVLDDFFTKRSARAMPPGAPGAGGPAGPPPRPAPPTAPAAPAQ